MTVTINNNTVTQNIQETLPLLLRLVAPEKFSKFDAMTPTTLDLRTHNSNKATINQLSNCEDDVLLASVHTHTRINKP